MKSVAIICEYNPFHRGHEYQIKRLRALFDEPTAVVCIMSGALTQRGEPAILDKYVRAESAVSCGADVVLELPSPWSMSCAQNFALGGVAIARAVGVDYLAFGSESGELAQLVEAAKRLASEEFALALESARASFPTLGVGALRSRVLRELYGEPESTVLDGSNDLLALEYLRALEGSGIEPICIKRVGENYNPDPSKEKNGFASASSVRRAIFSGHASTGASSLSELPEPSRGLAEREIREGRILRSSNLDSAVTAFLRFSHESMRGCAEVSGGIENRLHESAMRFSTLFEITEASLERNYSASRLRRAIFSGMLGFGSEDAKSPPEFTNLLAANEVGRELVARNRKSGFILTKPAKYVHLPESARLQFERSLKADALAALACEDKRYRDAGLILRKSPVIIGKGGTK